MIRVTSLAVLLLLPMGVRHDSGVLPDARHSPQRGAAARVPETLVAFNAKYLETCQQMDNSAAEALWADDGVDLIQGLDPMVGKAAISKWLDGVTVQTRGAHMDSCTIDWRDERISGDRGYEWGITHQKITFPNGKTFTNAGKILLILQRRPPNGDWRIELESWSSIASS